LPAFEVAPPIDDPESQATQEAEEPLNFDAFPLPLPLPRRRENSASPLGPPSSENFQ
jgi:hypothetical protein